jgi:heme exporter protein C
MTDTDTNKRGNAGKMGFWLLLLVTGVSIVLLLEQIFLRTPDEARMGFVQKIFYIHVPSAYCMYVAAIACFAGSVGYLLRGSDSWDALAKAGGEIAVLFGFVVLTTGPLWGAKAWGTYWTFDPRLTTSLLSVLIYVSYTVLRSFTQDGPGERKFAAGLGIFGAANLPIIHFAVKKWGGAHPVVLQGGGIKHPMMQLSFGFGMVAFTLLVVLLLWLRTRTELLRVRVADLEEDAIDLALDERNEA